MNENTKKILTAVAAGVLLVASCWFYFAGRGDVSDIGDRADETRSELESARKEQRDQAAALDRAENAADRSQLETVKKELIASKNLNEATQKSLERANQSLKQFEDEAKRKIRVKTRQRNLWIAISGGLLYAWIKK